jgi:hypothetical protein
MEKTMEETIISKHNMRAIFPFPDEEEAHFAKRAENAPSLSFPPSILQKVYDFSPDWVEVAYSDEGLSPFEAAATFLDDEGAKIEVRSALKNKARYCVIYSKEEILSHEYVHAARFGLHSDIFDEYFAYFLSFFYGHSFRAFLGPIFSSSREVWLFLLSLFLPLISAFFFEFLFPFFVALAMVLFLFFTSRLLVRWVTWWRCTTKVGLKLSVRLTDAEVKKFSRLKMSAIKRWIEKEKESSFRWKTLFELYCKDM